MCDSPGTAGNLRGSFLRDQPGSWAMNALQVTCIVGAMAFTGLVFQIGKNTPDATVPGAMPEAVITPSAPAPAGAPEASAGPEPILGAEPGLVTAAVPGALVGPPRNSCFFLGPKTAAPGLQGA